MSTKSSARPRIALVAIAAGIAALVAPTAASAGVPDGQVKVMTRNVYLGADLGPALAAPDQGSLAVATTGIYNNVKYTDINARAKLVAKEIAKAKPDLVGLQEIAQYREDTIDEHIDENGDAPGDPLNNVQDGPFTPATTVTYDWRAALMTELKKAKAKYRIVNIQREADIEVPATDRDKRLIIRDMILARKGAGVTTQDEDQGHYDHLLEVAAAGGALNVTVNRGWLFTEANVRGTQFRFLDTHLESFGDNDQPGPQLRAAQAAELVQAGVPVNPQPGPATYQSAGGTVVAVGDFNSDDDTVSGDDPLAYQALTTSANPPSNALTELSDETTGGMSCCFESETIDEDPATALPQIDHHIDKVFTNNAAVTEVETEIVGDTRRVHTESAGFGPRDLWASDHMGVVTTLQFPTP